MEEEEEYETIITIDMAGQGHPVKVEKKLIEAWKKRRKVVDKDEM